jgi:hypothetical protein
LLYQDRSLSLSNNQLPINPETREA